MHPHMVNSDHPARSHYNLLALFNLSSSYTRRYNRKVMRVEELGEFGVIHLLTQMVTQERRPGANASARPFQLMVDVGDDAAAARCGQTTELYTTDTVVEGVHFTRSTIPWQNLGWKVMAANISDIAAMGGHPIYALITLGLPPDTKMEDVRLLYCGLLDLANQYDVALVGGDVTRSPVVFVTVALTGVVEGNPTLRSAAKLGDAVAVTGYLGSSAGGLELMLKGLPGDEAATQYLINAHRRPKPCIPQGRLLLEQGVEAAMDISDGLVDDLSKLCHASGVAAQVEVDTLPIHPSLKQAFPHRYTQLALSGGEDYQLLFTAGHSVMERVLPMLPPPAAVVGEIVEGEAGQVTVVDSAGNRVSAPSGGWDHFR